MVYNIQCFELLIKINRYRNFLSPNLICKLVGQLVVLLLYIIWEAKGLKSIVLIENPVCKSASLAVNLSFAHNCRHP